MFRIKRSNLLQSKEFWNEMTLPPLNNVSHLFRGGRVIQYVIQLQSEYFLLGNFSTFDSAKYLLNRLFVSDNRNLFYLFACLYSFQCKHHIWSSFKKADISFPLSPHLQWNRPINCCFIFRPQLGQTRLLLISVPPAGWWKRPHRKCHTAGANLAHAPPRLG